MPSGWTSCFPLPSPCKNQSKSWRLCQQAWNNRIYSILLFCYSFFRAVFPSRAWFKVIFRVRISRRETKKDCMDEAVLSLICFVCCSLLWNTCLRDDISRVPVASTNSPSSMEEDLSVYPQ
ncbi:MAG: hypothetical protein BYD32DRAFT_407469 [Podila humilis]|nr:MAG: hypothetical protein BYD32DRAFT_407469 [Podila humilis]